jgi:AcrR family transcriptional regulator
MAIEERKAGRPREARLDEALHRAALEVFLERGYLAASLSEVARRANVGTTAIYRRWPTKAAMAMDVVVKELGSEPIPSTGSIREDLVEFTRLRVRQWRSPLYQQIVLPVVMEARRKSPLQDALSARFDEYRRPLLERLRRRAAAGELRAHADPERLLDFLNGPLSMALIFGRELPQESDAESIVDQVLEGFAPNGR